MVMAFFFRYLFLASSLLSYISATGGYKGCFDPNSDDEEVETIRIGQRHTICLILGNNANWSSQLDYVRYTFRPKADEYSKFHIDQSFKDLVQNGALGNGNQNLTYFFGVGKNISHVRMYYEPKQNDEFEDDDNKVKVFPFITAIVDVKDGVVLGLDWDNSCGFCSKKKCLENTYMFTGQLASQKSMRKGCYLTKEECNELTKQGDTTCDLNLYFVWTGTDADGKPFQSSGYRFSAFPPTSIENQFLNSLPDYSW